MTLKLFAFYESFFELCITASSSSVSWYGFFPIYSREDRVGELVFHAIDDNCVGFAIDLVEQFSVFKLERRVVVDKLSFDLKLQNCHCFLYLYV